MGHGLVMVSVMAHDGASHDAWPTLKIVPNWIVFVPLPAKQIS